MRKLSLIVAALAVISPLSRSDVLHKSRVPAGARWIAHVDVERLTSSQLFAGLSSGAMGDDFQLGLDDVEELCGLDPLKDVKSVTFFSTNESDDHTVGVIVLSPKVDAALVCFQREAGYHTVQVGTRTLHVWSENSGPLDGESSNGTQYGYLLRIPDSTDRIAVIAGKPESLVECVEVLEGNAPSLATTPRPTLSASPAPGAIVFAAAGEPLARLAEIEPASAIVKLAQLWTFELGESNRALYADLWIKTATNEDALRVQQILQGATALLGLIGSDPEISPKVQSLLGALNFTADGTHMTARFRYDVQDLLELMRALDDPSDATERRKGTKLHVEKKIRHRDEK